MLGKPLFLIRLLNKFIHFEIHGNEIFYLLLLIFAISDLYFIYGKSSAKKSITRLLSIKMIDPDEYQAKSAIVHSYDRNIYIFLTCIAMLLTIHKFGERHLRLADFKSKIAANKKEIEKLSPSKTPEAKKQD